MLDINFAQTASIVVPLGTLWAVSHIRHGNRLTRVETKLEDLNTNGVLGQISELKSELAEMRGKCAAFVLMRGRDDAAG